MTTIQLRQLPELCGSHKIAHTTYTTGVYINAAKLNKVQRSNLWPNKFSFLRMSISIAAKRQPNYKINLFWFKTRRNAGTTAKQKSKLTYPAK